MKRFKIATYNVNSIRSRLHIIIPWLEKNHPTVFCMQETKVEDERFPAKEFEGAGYHVACKGEKQYNGVAIASLERTEKVSFGLDDEGPADGDRLISGVFSGIHVVNTYVPQGHDRENPRFQYKLQWFKRLREFFARHYSPNEPLIWCGDLNVAPEEIDVHNPKRLLGHVCFNPEVWEGFTSVKSWGLVDVFRRHHPNEPGQYTFFDYRVPKAVERGLGWRVDHILATPPLADQSISCSIDMGPRLAEKSSDHTIVTAEFEV
ncbi:MAG: exodeoxyribonuclease III [Deltaproteobacteria bacterium RBG_13_52_11]|nr:MAG: exodeoxyribonuclease III [Deltaproteobacteria bacterium RBG_13_52_11]